MPRYDYRCTQGHIFEVIHPMAEVGTSRPCPVCGQPANTAFISPPGVNGTRVYLSDDARKSLRPMLRQETVDRIETVKDVDRELDRISKNYPHWDGFGKDVL